MEGSCGITEKNKNPKTIYTCRRKSGNENRGKGLEVHINNSLFTKQLCGGVKTQDRLSDGIMEVCLGIAPDKGKIKSIPNELPKVFNFKL